MKDWTVDMREEKTAIVETERLVLRNVAAKDADAMFDYRNNEVCAKYQRGQTRDFDAICGLIERHKNDVVSVDNPFMLSVALKQSDVMIGEIVVKPEDGTISMGYTFHYNYHRRGYAYEALTALMNLLHDRYPSWEFISFTEPENVPSMALLKKLDYKDMGYLPDMEARAFGKWMTPATEAQMAKTADNGK